jgi:hypothetical protein
MNPEDRPLESIVSPVTPPPAPSQNKTLLYVSSLIFVALLSGSSVYFWLRKTSPPVINQVTAAPTPLLSPSPSVSPLPSAVVVSVTPTNFTVPANWRQIDCPEVSLKFSIPPDWKTGADKELYGNPRICHSLFYYRDAGFAPNRGMFERELYKNGSRRDQYINRFVDYENIRDEMFANSLTTEKNINGLEVLLIVPKDPTNHVAPNPGLIFVNGNYLYTLSLQHGDPTDKPFYYWNSAAEMKYYYQILSSLKFTD